MFDYFKKLIGKKADAEFEVTVDVRKNRAIVQRFSDAYGRERLNERGEWIAIEEGDNRLTDADGIEIDTVETEEDVACTEAFRKGLQGSPLVNVIDCFVSPFGTLAHVMPRSFNNPVSFNEAWLLARLQEGYHNGSDGCDETIEQLTADYASYAGFRIAGEKVGEMFAPEFIFYFDDESEAQAFRGRWVSDAEGR